MTGTSITRRTFCNGAAISVAAATLGPAAAQARPEPVTPAFIRRAGAGTEFRTIRILHRRTGERYRGVYFENGAYIPEVMSLLDWILRDVHADKTHPMDPRLIDVLSRMERSLEVDELYVTSGYRCRETNEWLRRRTGMAARNSYHIEGMAADVHTPRVSARSLARAAERNGAGGVGYYPRHGFVHVDVGPSRRWRG